MKKKLGMTLFYLGIGYLLYAYGESILVWFRDADNAILVAVMATVMALFPVITYPIVGGVICAGEGGWKKTGYNKLLVDFDDMLTLANELLQGDRRLLQKYQERYDYLFTDESQDTSMVQHVMIKKLVERHGNLCVVADDDQSLYSWRGAEPSYLLNFKKVYPNAVISFVEGYRGRG